MIDQRELIGRWRLKKDDPQQEDVTMEFLEDGNLNYIAHAKDKKQIIRLTYYVEGDYIVTDQPSDPRIEKTKAKIDRNTLFLTHDGVATAYVKE